MRLFLLLFRARTNININAVISSIAYRLLFDYCNFLALTLYFLWGLITKYSRALLFLGWMRLFWVVVFHDGSFSNLTGYLVLVSVMIVWFMGDHLGFFWSICCRNGRFLLYGWQRLYIFWLWRQFFIFFIRVLQLLHFLFRLTNHLFYFLLHLIDHTFLLKFYLNSLFSLPLAYNRFGIMYSVNLFLQAEYIIQ